MRSLLEADPMIMVSLASDLNSSAADVQVLSSAAFASWVTASHGGRLDAAVIVLGASAQDIRRLWKEGVSWGVLPLETSGEELCAAVRAVAAGLVVGPRPLLGADDESQVVPGPLSEREIEVLGMVLRGLANKQVAAQLGISEHTVKFHVSSIYTKLNVSNRTEAVREGLRNGWITL